MSLSSINMYFIRCRERHDSGCKKGRKRHPTGQNAWNEGYQPSDAVESLRKRHTSSHLPLLFHQREAERMHRHRQRQTQTPAWIGECFCDHSWCQRHWRRNEHSRSDREQHDQGNVHHCIQRLVILSAVKMYCYYNFIWAWWVNVT